jgi:hypothetical protein
MTSGGPISLMRIALVVIADILLLPIIFVLNQMM